MEPPNPYDNLPEVGSTTEFYMTQGDWAQLTADWLQRRKAATYPLSFAQTCLEEAVACGDVTAMAKWRLVIEDYGRMQGELK